MEKWEVFSDRIFLNTKKEVWAIMQDKHTFAAVIPKQWETAEANANLIVTTVNACISINKENPMAVAKSIVDTRKTLKHTCDRLYGIGGNESLVSSELYKLLKSLYNDGFEALARVDSPSTL